MTMRQTHILLLAALTFAASATPAIAQPSDRSNIVESAAKAPIDQAGDVAGERTDVVINLDRSLDPAISGRALLAGNTIKVTLPEDFHYLGGPITNPGPPPACPPPAGTCGTGVLLQGWPQNPIPPSPANYTLTREGTHTIVFTASRDLVPGDPTLNGPGIKQMHLILSNYVNPHPGRYAFEVEAETGPGGARETGTAFVHIRPDPRASINVTSVYAGPPPFSNTIFQSAPTNSPLPLEWNFLVWDRDGEPAIGMTVHQVNPNSAQLKSGSRVVGTITIASPEGARGQEISGGPSTLVIAPVKNLPSGRLTLQFITGDMPGLYVISLRMNNGTSVTMHATATSD